MSSFTIVGQDTFTLNGRNIVGLANGSVINLTHPSQLMTMTIGKNSAAMFAKNEEGVSAQLELRIIRGCDDDKFLNNLMKSQESNAIAFKLMEATLVKQLGAGVAGGQIQRDVYSLQGGTFVQKVDVMYDTSGDTDQAVAVYSLQFAVAERTLA